MGKEFRYPIKYRLSLNVGGYHDKGQLITAYQFEVDSSDGSFPVEPEVRAGLVERALEVLLSEREGKAA
jgi:hypothetical protein